MPRFLTGDELGNIKSLRCTTSSKPVDTKVDVYTLFDGSKTGREKAVQALTVVPSGLPSETLVCNNPSPLSAATCIQSNVNLRGKVASAHADGSTTTFSLRDNALKTGLQWNEPRLRPGQKFVGLASSSK